MRKEWLQQLIITCAVALVLVTTGCSKIEIKVKATDLSPVSVDTERASIEQALGRPARVEAVNGITVAVYQYNKGKVVPYQYPEILNTDSLFNFLVFAVDYPIEIAKARDSQRARLVTIFDANQRLVFAASVSDEEEEDQSKLKELGALYISAIAGDVDSQYQLGKISMIADQRMQLFKRAAIGDHAEAQYQVAISVNESAEKIGWLRKAAAQGHIDAQFELATALVYGPKEFVDRPQAKAWLTKAAEAGNTRALAELDKQSEFESNLKRAELGHADAQYAVGNAYAHGEAVKKDQDEAVGWWRKAAALEHEGAIEALADVASREEKLRNWRVAASQGDVDAQRLIGNAYRLGDGVKMDMTEAVRWYEQAAMGGDAFTQYILGTLYDYGGEIERDLVVAVKWYTLAAPDYFPAKNRKKWLSEHLSSQQIADGEKRAREWLKAHPQ